MDTQSGTVSKGFPAVRQNLGLDHNRANSSMMRSKNSSFMSHRNSDVGKTAHSALKGKVQKNFGFRNHSLALGSTVRHFQTISDFPQLPAQLDRNKSTTVQQKEWHKTTQKKMPELMDALKRDPRALEIFIDELALADQSQPKHLKFLADLPHTTHNSSVPRHMVHDPSMRGQHLQFTLQNATNMFNETFNVRQNQPTFNPDPNRVTGYNLGRNKGSFVTQQNTREYFEKAIRPSNKRIFESSIQANRIEKNNASFIQFDSNKREEFEDRVQRYMENIEKEEKEELERERREEMLATLASDDGNISLQKTQFPSIGETSKTHLDHGAQSLQQQSQSSVIKVKKNKKIPNYMKPNAAWLRREAGGNPVAEVELQKSIERRKSVIYSKLNATMSRFATMKLKQGFMQATDNLNLSLLDNLLLRDQTKGNSKGFQQKTYKVNQENHVLMELFRSKQTKAIATKTNEDVKKPETIRTKLTKGNLRAAISRRFRGPIAERVVQRFPEFSIAQDFHQYCDLIEKLLNTETDRLLRIAFDVYDFNQDKLICELDSYTNMQTFSDDDEVFLAAFSYDLCIIGETLDKRRQNIGVKDYDHFTKLQAMQRKLKAKGASLDPSILVNVTSDDNLPDDFSDDDDFFNRDDTAEAQIQHTKSRRSVHQKSRKTLRRQDTAKSNKSRQSARSASQKGGGGLQGAQSMASLFEEKEEEEVPPHPYDAVFGNKINTVIQRDTGGSTIGLSFSQFKEINWPNKLPYFICDLIETISGFSMAQELQERASRKIDEDRLAQIHNKVKQEKEKSAGIKINEKQLKERFEKEMQTEKEKKLAEARVLLTPSVYDKLWRFFNFMKSNINEKNQSRCFMTEKSIQLNLKKYFGHKTGFLEERLYRILSNGKANKRIYMDDFIENFYKPLFEGAPVVKANFMFRMLDFDDDGYLHASDLVHSQQYIDELSDFGQEIYKLSQYYITTYLNNRGKVKENDRINMFRYKDLLDDSGEPGKKKNPSSSLNFQAAMSQSEPSKEEEGVEDGKKVKKPSNPEDEAQKALSEAFMKFRSCGIDEIKLKVMSTPEKHKESSVFIASKAQIELAKQRELLQRKMDSELQAMDPTHKKIAQTNKQLKAILAKENKLKDPFRTKKAVTFTINLASEEDEDLDEDEQAEYDSMDGSQLTLKEQSSPDKVARDVESNNSKSSSKKASPTKKAKVLVVNATDEVQELNQKSTKASVLSKSQRNS